jgi:hypothetical protein
MAGPSSDPSRFLLPRWSWKQGQKQRRQQRRSARRREAEAEAKAAAKEERQLEHVLEKEAEAEAKAAAEAQAYESMAPCLFLFLEKPSNAETAKAAREGRKREKKAEARGPSWKRQKRTSCQSEY